LQSIARFRKSRRDRVRGNSVLPPSSVPPGRVRACAIVSHDACTESPPAWRSQSGPAARGRGQDPATGRAVASAIGSPGMCERYTQRRASSECVTLSRPMPATPRVLLAFVSGRPPGEHPNTSAFFSRCVTRDGQTLDADQCDQHLKPTHAWPHRHARHTNDATAPTDPPAPRVLMRVPRSTRHARAANPS
jgi:hypothetical protein